MKMKLTVVTIVRNDPVGLNMTIQSVKDECPWAEHLIVDGSDAPTELHNSRPNVVYVHSKDRGISHAFNKGILLAQSEYLVFINAGDTVVPGGGAKLVEALASESHDCVWFAVFRSFDDGTKSVYRPRLSLLRFAMAAPHQGMIVKRLIFSEIGLFPMQRYSMDHHLALRMISRSPKYQIKCIEDPLVDYPAGGHSTQGGVKPFLWNCWNVAKIRLRDLPVAVCANMYLAAKSFVKFKSLRPAS